MSGTSTQPSKVSTEDTPPDRPSNVITDEVKHSAASDPTAAPDGDKKADPGQTTDDSATPGDDKQKPRRNRAAERKIARLTKKLKTQEGQSQQDRAKIADLQKQIDELSQGTPTAPAKEPNLRDFKTPQEYARAHAKWEAAQKKGDDKKRAPDPSTANPPEDPPIVDEEARIEFVTRGKEKLGDEFLEAMEDRTLPVTQAMGEYLLDSDLGPDLYIWLFNNPEEAEKIARKSESAITRQFDKLAKKIKDHGSWDFDEEPGDQGKPAGGKSDKADTSKQRKTTTAPDPPSDPETDTETPAGSLEDMDMDDYAAARRRQMKTGPRF